MESAGVKLTVKSEDIVSCTNLRKVIETYKVQGGPSPAEVERALKARQKTFANNKKVIDRPQRTATCKRRKDTQQQQSRHYSLSKYQKA